MARMVESASSTCRVDARPAQACWSSRLSGGRRPSLATQAAAATPNATVIPQIEAVVTVNIFRFPLRARHFAVYCHYRNRAAEHDRPGQDDRPTGLGKELTLMRFLVTVLTAIALAAIEPRAARAAEPSLVITKGGESQHYTTATLLARADLVSISVPNDVSYRRSTTYRALPLLALLGKNSDTRLDTLEARAADGFVAQIPLELVTRGAAGGAVAWLAVEDPARPWEPLPHQRKSAGPFYVVWENPQRSNIRSEQWPHWLVSLELVESPLHRWPQLELPAEQTSAARAGQKIFLSFCLPCHRLNGGGASDAGPDLGQPMNATEYLTDAGLRGIIRNPRSVRTWPNQTMGGFGNKTLPDSDVDDLLVYLRAMATKPSAASGK
jgi:mono/diheme cytochrome c family protein